mgnify:CR=1 FL=1
MYQVPTLKLVNVEMKNFMVDYQSLVYIETDNYVLQTDTFGQKQMYQYGNFNITANISITDSKIFDCAFAKGMIYNPKF